MVSGVAFVRGSWTRNTEAGFYLILGRVFQVVNPDQQDTSGKVN